MKKLIICLAVLVLSAAFFTKPAAAATRLAGVSVQSACNYQITDRYTTAQVLIKPTTVYSWRCVGIAFLSRPELGNGAFQVDLSRECRRVWGSTAYASYTNFFNPYSWGCYR